MSQEEHQEEELYFKDVQRFPLLDAKEERELTDRIRQGDEVARQKMIVSNLRLVIWFARRYQKAGLPLKDLIQEGNLGLMRAIETYDYKNGRFASYAYYWIRHYIERALKRYRRLIRLSEPVEEDLRKGLRKWYSVPTVTFLEDELAKDWTLKDTLVSDCPLPEEEAVKIKNRDELRQVLETYLTPKEFFAVWYYFGLEDGKEWTMQEIGNLRGVSREAVRVNIQTALNKLRHPAKKKILEELLK